MRAVIQRVQDSSLHIDNKLHSKIGQGLLVLAGFENNDTEEDLKWLAGKISRLRIFSDEAGLMNKSVSDINGEIMLVSQFTLHAFTKKGNRPSYIKSAKPDVAIPLYEMFKSLLDEQLLTDLQTGVFGADMQISLTNDGPVTIVIDSKNKE